MPQLVEAGKVYKAIPPLYGWKNGKKTNYFTNQIDFVRFVQKSFIDNNTISVIGSKTPMAGKDITVMFMNNEDYVYEIERLATTFGVEPQLLELAMIANSKGSSISEIKKRLKDLSRFMDVTKIGNHLEYEGTIHESNFLPMCDRLLNNTKYLQSIINKNNNFYFDMNGKMVSLYQVMKEFDRSTPSGVQRYKGLGEMDEEQLAISTLLPTGDRTLIQYTIENMKEEFEAIRTFESDRSKLLQFVGNVKRVDLLD